MWNSIPRLSTHNVLPFTSLVFEVVEAGKLEEFQEMLSSGKASLWDQDEHGRSLLFVS